MGAIDSAMQQRGGEGTVEWLVKNSGPATDSFAVDLVRSRVTGVETGSVSEDGMMAMDDAATIKEPALRRAVSRGAFRRLLVSRPQQALAYLSRPGLDPEVVVELKAIAEEKP